MLCTVLCVCGGHLYYHFLSTKACYYVCIILINHSCTLKHYWVRLGQSQGHVIYIHYMFCVYTFCTYNIHIYLYNLHALAGQQWMVRFSHCQSLMMTYPWSLTAEIWTGTHISIIIHVCSSLSVIRWLVCTCTCVYYSHDWS